MDIAALDWVLLVVLLASLALGAWRGLVYEVLSVIGWIAAFVVAQLYADVVGKLLPMGNTAEPLRHAAGFVVTFIGTAFAAGLVSWVAKKMIEGVGLRPVDRTLGAAFGLVRGVLLLLAAATVVNMTPVKDAVWWQKSAGAGVLNRTLKSIKPILPPSLGQYITQTMKVQTPVCAES